MNLIEWLTYLVQSHDWLTLLAIGVAGLGTLGLVWMVGDLIVCAVRAQREERESEYQRGYRRGRADERAVLEADPVDASRVPVIYERDAEGQLRRIEP